ncbi:MAG: hypothetical protein P4L82_07860 [Ancalomicrobiaceae bacterium]|nr:hypothetical protein [Ancalomicrobiaceae bacterium]
MAQPPLDWTIDVGLVTEPLLWSGYLKATGLSALLMGSLLSFLMVVTGDPAAIGPMWALTGIAVAVVVGLGLVVAAVTMGNRLSMRFVVDARGVERHSIDRRTRAAAKAAIVLGVVSGRPGVTGAGLLAQSQADRSAAWSGLVSARYHPSRSAISLRNSWRTVMIVFCPPRLYATVAARVAAELAEGRRQTRARRNPLPGLLVRTVVTVITCLPFFALPYPYELDLFAPILTLCFALAALWLVPHLGLVAIGGLGWMWFEILMRGALDISYSRSDQWGPLLITAVCTTVLVVLIIGLILGWFGSGLADDEAELTSDDRPDSE